MYLMVRAKVVVKVVVNPDPLFWPSAVYIQGHSPVGGILWRVIPARCISRPTLLITLDTPLVLC